MERFRGSEARGTVCSKAAPASDLHLHWRADRCEAVSGVRDAWRAGGTAQHTAVHLPVASNSIVLPESGMWAGILTALMEASVLRSGMPSTCVSVLT
jgi:hypothetical protein